MRGPERLDRIALAEALQRRGLDAAIAVSPENVYYTSGTLIATQKLIRDRLAFAIFPVAAAPTLLVAIMEESLSREESWMADVRPYVEFAESPIGALALVLEERGLAHGRVGLELGYLTAAHYLELNRALPHLEVVSCEDLFWELRMIKSPQEAAHLARIARVTEEAIAAAFVAARPGMTERDVATVMRARLLASGADSVPLCVLASGRRSIHAHPAPDATPLQPGGAIRVDFCGEFDGYHSDLMRMAVIGQPSPHQADLYRRVRDAQRRVVERMRPGARACDVFQYACDTYAKAGLVMEEPHIGHGLGISLHEPPVLQPGSTMELQPGMVLAIEPDYIEKEVACYCVEDLVHITESGPAILSDAISTTSMTVIG